MNAQPRSTGTRRGTSPVPPRPTPTSGPVPRQRQRDHRQQHSLRGVPAVEALLDLALHPFVPTRVEHRLGMLLSDIAMWFGQTLPARALA